MLRMLHCQWRVIRVSVATLAAAWLAMHGAAAAELDVHMKSRPDGGVIEATALLRADLATAWSVLTDYDGYERFVPGLRASRVLQRRGAAVTVRQLTEASIAIFHKPMTITYEIVEERPTGVHSRVVDGCECTLESDYALTPLGARVRLFYTGRFGASGELRAPFEASAAEQQITRHLQALADEIERQAAAHDASRDTTSGR